MRTPKEILDRLLKDTNSPSSVNRHEVLISEESIAIIQKDAFQAGRAYGWRKAVAHCIAVCSKSSAASRVSKQFKLEPPSYVP